MEDQDSCGPDRNRRRFLTALGALGVTGVAGCNGDGTDTPTDTDAGGNGNGNGTDTPDTTAGGTTTTQPPTSSPEETPPPTLTPREPQFVPLFDGGPIEDAYWHQTDGNATYESRDENTIVGISSSSGPNSFLTTYKVFDDFVLEFEAWVDPDGLNSGIQVRSHTTANNPPTFGPQVELELSGESVSGESAPQFPPGQSGYVYGEQLSTGWLSVDDGEPPGHETFDNGEWNDFRIRVEGDRIQTFINDERIEDLDLSQFSDVDALIGMGIIGLQVHSIGTDGREVRWRNLRIKELDVGQWDRPFNGRNTDGWTNPRGTGDVSVSNGELRLSGDEQFFLLTEESYEDFVFETWVHAEAKGGVMFRNPGESVVAGYRAEIDPTEDALSGSLYDVTDGTWLKNTDGESNSGMAYKPEGWNYYRVAADGETIRVWVNGITTAAVSDDGESAGGIGLQHRGGDGPIRFRDMEVKTLDESTLN